MPVLNEMFGREDSVGEIIFNYLSRGERVSPYAALLGKAVYEGVSTFAMMRNPYIAGLAAGRKFFNSLPQAIGEQSALNEEKKKQTEQQERDEAFKNLTLLTIEMRKKIMDDLNKIQKNTSQKPAAQEEINLWGGTGVHFRNNRFLQRRAY